MRLQNNLMKIVIFDINRLSFEGGAEKYLSEIGITFSKKGDEVCFIGNCRPIMKLFIWSGIFLFINPFWKLPKLFSDFKKAPALNEDSQKYISFSPLKLKALVPFLSERKKIRRILNEAEAIFIKNEIFELLFFWLLNIENKNKYLMVFSSINYPFPNSFRAKVHNLVYQSKIYKFLVKKIGKIVVSNKQDEKYFLKTIGLAGKNVFFIPYGLEKDYFVKPKEIKVTSGFKILFVARMEEQKGIIFLKQIIENINRDQKLKNVSFSLVGSGPLEEIPCQLAEKYNNVEYKGQLPPLAVRKCYLESDLVIITSKWETFSYVCLEAQACGVPVVSFDIPGPQDIISKETGSLITLGNISEMQKCIYRYFDEKEKYSPKNYLQKRLEISKNAAEKFSIEITVNKLKHLT